MFPSPVSLSIFRITLLGSKGSASTDLTLIETWNEVELISSLLLESKLTTTIQITLIATITNKTKTKVVTTSDRPLLFFIKSLPLYFY